MPTDVRTWDWQAIAIFVTGFLAVGGAWLVGRRQTQILRRQTIIQGLTLKHELFDRRYSVFERAEQFLREIIQHADDPDLGTRRDFVVAMGESRFLFEPKVREGLDEIWKKWAEFHALKTIMKNLFETQHHYGDGNPEKEGVVLKWFAERFTSLPDLFYELKMSGFTFVD